MEVLVVEFLVLSVVYIGSWISLVVVVVLVLFGLSGSVFVLSGGGSG